MAQKIKIIPTCHILYLLQKSLSTRRHPCNMNAMVFISATTFQSARCDVLLLGDNGFLPFISAAFIHPPKINNNNDKQLIQHTPTCNAIFPCCTPTQYFLPQPEFIYCTPHVLFSFHYSHNPLKVSLLCCSGEA